MTRTEQTLFGATMKLSTQFAVTLVTVTTISTNRASRMILDTETQPKKFSENVIQNAVTVTIADVGLRFSTLQPTSFASGVIQWATCLFHSNHADVGIDGRLILAAQSLRPTPHR